MNDDIEDYFLRREFREPERCRCSDGLCGADDCARCHPDGDEPDDDPSVRLWLVIEGDRGMGATVCSGHATEDEAIAAAQGSHEYVEWVDIPWSRLESLKPNAEAEGR